MKLQGGYLAEQTEWAADLIRTLPVPEGAPVVVLGDTAFDSRPVHAACRQRGFACVVAMNPERMSGDGQTASQSPFAGGGVFHQTSLFSDQARPRSR